MHGIGHPDYFEELSTDYFSEPKSLAIHDGSYYGREMSLLELIALSKTILNILIHIPSIMIPKTQ